MVSSRYCPFYQLDKVQRFFVAFLRIFVFSWILRRQSDKSSRFHAFSSDRLTMLFISPSRVPSVIAREKYGCIDRREGGDVLGSLIVDSERTSVFSRPSVVAARRLHLVDGIEFHPLEERPRKYPQTPSIGGTQRRMATSRFGSRVFCSFLAVIAPCARDYIY